MNVDTRHKSKHDNTIIYNIVCILFMTAYLAFYKQRPVVAKFNPNVYNQLRYQ